MDEKSKKEINSLQELGKFTKHWRNFTFFKSMAADGFVFPAKIVYLYDDCKKQIGDLTNVMISLGEYNKPGKVAIFETQLLSPQYFHLDFMANFQTYHCDGEYNLIITGNSPKVGGNYSVKVEVVE